MLFKSPQPIANAMTKYLTAPEMPNKRGHQV